VSAVLVVQEPLLLLLIPIPNSVILSSMSTGLPRMNYGPNSIGSDRHTLYGSGEGKPLAARHSWGLNLELNSRV